LKNHFLQASISKDAKTHFIKTRPSGFRYLSQQLVDQPHAHAREPVIFPKWIFSLCALKQFTLPNVFSPHFGNTGLKNTLVNTNFTQD